MRSGCQPGCLPGTRRILVAWGGASKRGSVDTQGPRPPRRRHSGIAVTNLLLPADSGLDLAGGRTTRAPVNRLPCRWDSSPAKSIPTRTFRPAASPRRGRRHIHIVEFAIQTATRATRAFGGSRNPKHFSGWPRRHSVAPALMAVALARTTTSTNQRTISILRTCPGGQSPDRLRREPSAGAKFSVSSPRSNTSTALRNRPRHFDL